jgi:hypothetical protein
MRRCLVIAPALLLIVACATGSGGRFGTTRTIMEAKDDLWFAALDAVQDYGARISSSNRTAGLIIARVDVDTFGSAVRIDISIRSPLEDSSTVSVSASEPGQDTTDPQRLDELREIEADLLDMIEARAGRYGGRRRALPGG